MDSIPNSQWNVFLENVSYERLSTTDKKSQQEKSNSPELENIHLK